MGLNHDEAIMAAYAIRGECWPTELGWLYHNLRDSRKHVEIGSFCGKSLFVTGLAMEKGLLLTVDPFALYNMPGYVEPKPGWTEQQLRLTVESIRHHNRHLDVQHWGLTSLDAFNKAAEKGLRFDSCYIDACHYYAECKADIESWKTLVKPGGLLCGHDYWAKDQGVMEAVAETLQGDFEVAPQTRIWFHRVK